jgi:hypothetical protein
MRSPPALEELKPDPASAESSPKATWNSRKKKASTLDNVSFPTRTAETMMTGSCSRPALGFESLSPQSPTDRISRLAFPDRNWGCVKSAGEPGISRSSTVSGYHTNVIDETLSV